MYIRVFKYIGRYGAGLKFTTDPIDIQIYTNNASGVEWEDLGEHNIPESLLSRLGWNGVPIFTLNEWASE